MANGRRSYLTYSPEIADEFCALIAEGKSIRQITEQPGMPSRRAVLEVFGVFRTFEAARVREPRSQNRARPAERGDCNACYRRRLWWSM
jgi:hypothetical protein